MVNKRFTDIVSTVQNEVRDTSSAFQTIAKDYTNTTYSSILKRLIQSNVIDAYRDWTLTTVAGTSTYAAPHDFGEIVYSHDTTNGVQHITIDERELISRFPSSISTTGTPVYVVVMSNSSLMNQPSASTAIRVVSDNAADTSQSVLLRGISGSAEYYETVSLNGTTSASSTNSYDWVLEAVKSATTTGKVTISYITGSETASVISPESYFERYKKLRYQFIPAGAYTFNIRYRREFKPMASDYDIPVVDVAEGIEYGAIARAWEYKRQFANATYFMNKFEAWFERYVTDVAKSQVNQFDIQPYPRNY